jgi:hypothetical protein
VRLTQRNRHAAARTVQRTHVLGVVSMCSSARKRWTQRSQFDGIPRSPSQTLMKAAAYEIALGAKLCSSTP